MQTAIDVSIEQGVLSEPKYFFRIKTWQLFIVLVIGVWVNSWIMNDFVLTREVYLNLLSDRLEISRIEDLLNLNQKFKIWSMIGTPLLIWLSISFLSLIIQFPLLLKSINISLKKMFRILTFAQISLWVSGFIKTIWLFQMKPEEITEQSLMFIPLSLTNLINISAYSKPVLGVLGRMNVFEMIWIIIVALGIFSTGKMKKVDAFLVVFLVWVLLTACQWVIIVYLNKM